MNLNLLKVFDLLYSEQNATIAAERLGISQSAVSASLRKLRRIYADPLFERTQRGLKPTAQAILLHPRIADALALMQSTLPSTDAGVDLKQIVTIGLSDDLELAFGPELIKEQTEVLPGVRIIFQQTNSALVEAGLIDRMFDFALTAGGISDRRIGKTTLGQSGYGCVLANASQDTSEPISLPDYLARPHLLISYNGLVGVVDEVLSEIGHQRNIIAATSQFSMVPSYVAGTDIIATLPSHAATTLARIYGLRNTPCPVPFPATSVELSWRYETLRNEVMAEMRLLIERTFAKKSLLH
ncbi:LysR family transcriptional regulator [Cohaesibacter celericrescens]|nr:LysR family transcriptional regulator [Cohaesibacter celericrescens]